ncbi:MAG: hypothetical protein SOH81_05935 [Acetobacter sp.]|jgi:type VI protein secretion system component VasF
MLSIDLSAGDKTRGLRAAQKFTQGVDHDGNPIRNRDSYRAAIRNEADTAKQIITARPDLMSAVQSIRTKKTPDKRKAALEDILKTMPESQRNEARAYLSPMTDFGYKGAKDTDG